MLSSLSCVRAVSRVVRSCHSLSRGSINSVYLCKHLSTTHRFRQEDNNLLPSATENFSHNNNNKISTRSEDFPKDVSPTVDKYGRIDIIPEVLEEFFQTPKCHGCGTVFQSEDREKPGYIVAAKNPALQNTQGDAESLKPVVCERCFNLQHYNKGTQVCISPNEVTGFLSHIARRKALILYMVDITDLPGSMVPGLLDIVGPTKRIIVVANKLDVLPADGKPRFQYDELHDYVWHQCQHYGLQDANIKDVCLISAKTGFGIPVLVDRILKHWDEKGDLYLVGSNNTGKTSLFNALVDLTNVHKKKGDMLHRATVSRLPGTTLSLLRFACGHWKMTKLKYRLQDGTPKYEKDIADGEEYDIDPEIIDRTQTSFKNVTTEETTLSATEAQESKIDHFKPELVSGATKREHQSWFYDTPGILNESQVTNFLTMDELKLLHSNYWIVPRTFVLRPGQTFLLGGLARVDYVDITRMPRQHESSDKQTLTEANKSIYFTIFTSPNLPIHVLNIAKVEEFYNKHAGNQLLKVPSGGSNRMASFPGLQGRDFTITGIGWNESAADLVLSNVGWVAITAGQQADVQVTGYTPNGVGLVLREPALLPTSVNQRGKRGVRYQGNTNYSGYEAHRNSSPQLVNFLSHGQRGVYQWFREVKRKTKQQTALLRAKKMEKSINKSLEGDKESTLLDDGADGRSEPTEKLTS